MACKDSAWMCGRTRSKDVTCPTCGRKNNKQMRFRDICDLRVNDKMLLFDEVQNSEEHL